MSAERKRTDTEAAYPVSTLLHPQQKAKVGVGARRSATHTNTFRGTAGTIQASPPALVSRMLNPVRPRIVLFGDSLTQRGQENGFGWGSLLADVYTRNVGAAANRSVSEANCANGPQ